VLVVVEMVRQIRRPQQTELQTQVVAVVEMAGLVLEV
jgi:hypothetical protein